MTAYKACKLYSVNSGTISAHLRGTKSENKGRPPRFNVQQEQVLLDLILQLASCLTNEAVTNLLEAEENKKRHREETRKKELEEKEQNRVLKALQKANLNRKQCDCGLKYEEDIKYNKSRWLSCFKCCFDC